MSRILLRIFLASLISLNIWAGEDHGGGHGGGSNGATHFQNHCASCHGKDGISIAPFIPNLSGQKSAYVVTQLKDFRSGIRTGSTMPQQVANMTDEEINEISAYIATLNSCHH